jgi:hypothetical protein
VSTGRTAPNPNGSHPQSAASPALARPEVRASPASHPYNFSTADQPELQQDSGRRHAASPPAVTGGGPAAPRTHAGTAAKATVGVQVASTQTRATPPKASVGQEPVATAAAGPEEQPRSHPPLRHQPLEHDSLEDLPQDPRLRQAGERFESEIRSLLRKTAPHRRHGRRPWRRADPGEASSADTTRDEEPGWDADEADIRAPRLEPRRASSPHRRPMPANPVDSDLATVMVRVGEGRCRFADMDYFVHGERCGRLASRHWKKKPGAWASART